MDNTLPHIAVKGTANPNTALSTCMREAVSLARPMMLELVNSAVTVMRARQSAEKELPARMAMGESADALARQGELLAERFPAVLQQACARVARADATSAPKPVAAMALRFDQLELMDDEQVQGRIESARLQQSAALSCERELGELDALVCAAQGLASVQPDRNPFRPQIYGEAIAEVLSLAGASSAERLQWMPFLGASVGSQLRKVYQQLADVLRSQQVKAVSYAYGGASQGAAPSFSHAAPRRGAQQGGGEHRERADTSRLTVNQLRQVLGGEHFHPAGLPADDAHADGMAQELHELHALAKQARAVPTGQAASEPDSELHTSRAHALSVHELTEDLLEKRDEGVQSEAVAQDVVRMMVDNLCDDQRLLPCVRDWVGSLEPPLLALAAVDVGFLSDKRHAARQLLDQVTARSLGFASDTAPGFADFFNPVVQACAELKPHGLADAQPFVLAWQNIEHAWSQQKSAAQIQREHAMQALLQVEQRNLLADKIAMELTRRNDARLAPIFVKQFFAGPWSQVLAKARLSSAQVDTAQDYLDLVPDLLWSVVPEQASKNRPRLARMIPGLLSLLRSGLATIGSPEHEGAAFFAQLMLVHEAGLKASMARSAAQPAPVAASQMPAPVGSAISAREALDQELDSHEDDAVWLAPQEARDSGFMSSLAGAFDDATPSPPPAVPGALASQALAHPTPAPVDDFPAAETPTLGSWVELLSNGQWVRAQLTWASPHGTLFMFTGAAGNPYSMTRRALDKMQAGQTLRIISQDSLVAGALNAVAQTALRNTINTSAG